MSRTIFKTRLTELNQVTPTMKELKLEVLGENTFKFKGGQFAMLQVSVEGQEKPVQRAYSIASGAGDERAFNLLIKHVPGGVASEYVAKLKVNDELSFTGPWGKCLFKTPAPEQVLFLCTGSGLSQHMSFLLSDAAQWPLTKFNMLIGVGNEEEVFYHDELKAVQKLVPNFNYEWIVSRPKESWKGRKGWVTHFIKEFECTKIPTHVYVCGRADMIKGVKQVLVEENGFPKENLIVENFG